MHTHPYDVETHKNCVSLVPIFNHLGSEHLHDIVEITQSVSYKEGETLYQAGDASDSLYIVNSGRIKNYRLTDSGKEQLIRMLNPGDFTGEYALFNDSIHESYAEASSDTNICMIKRSDLQSLLTQHPSISMNILAAFSTRLEESEKQTTLFATEKVETRIALFLVQSLDHDSSEVTLPMSKRDLASYLGTTPETLSRRLTRLEKRGYIKRKPNNKIDILNVDELLLV